MSQEVENTGTTVASTELDERRGLYAGRNLVVLLMVGGRVSCRSPG